MPRHHLSIAIVVALAAAGCGKSTPAPAPTTAAASPDASADTTPAPPAVVSPLADAKAALETPITAPADVEGSLARAEALLAWADANPGHADAKASRLLGARTTLLTVAAAATSDTAGMSAALGPDEAMARHLRQTLARLEPLKSAGPVGVEINRLRLAARAMLATVSTAGATDAPLDRAGIAKVATLSDEDPTLGKAVASLWLKTLLSASGYGAEAATHGRVATFATQGGALLCPGCATMGDVDSAGVFALLKRPDTAALLGCEAASKAVATATTPAAVAQAYAACESLAAAKLEPSALAGANALFVAGLGRAAALGGQTAATWPKDARLALPSPALTTTLDEAGDATPRAIEGLGLDGMDVAPTEAVWVVGTDGVRGGMRPTIAIRDGELVSLSAQAGATIDDPAVISLDDLAAAEPDKDSGGVLAITTRAAAVAKALGAKPDDEAPRAAELVIDRAVPASAVAKTLTSLKAAGYDTFRFAKTATVDSTLPMVVQTTPETLPEGVSVGFARPIYIHLSKDAVDVWGPEDVATPAPAAAPATRQPNHLRPGYRGTTLVRLRTPVPETDANALSAVTLSHVVNAVTYWRLASGAGPVIHVGADPDVKAADVLRTARAIQEASGDTLKAIDVVWPGASCKSDPALAGCATAIAVAFSTLGAPSDRGITDKPVERKTAPKPKAPPKPAASDEFCNKRDIQVQMRKKAGDFRFCYERQLQLVKNLSGRVTTSFIIGLDGKVAGTPRVTSSTLKNDKVHECLVKRISKISFAKPDGGQCAVRWPFKFQQN